MHNPCKNKNFFFVNVIFQFNNDDYKKLRRFDNLNLKNIILFNAHGFYSTYWLLHCVHRSKWLL